MRIPLVLLATTLILASCAFAEPAVGLECQRTPANGQELREGEDPRDPDGPLAGKDVTGMTAAAVGQLAEEAGFGVTYRYEYDVGPQPLAGSSGYAECWCVPPPDGEVFEVAYDSIGRVIVFVDSGAARADVRAQPTMGWGCDEAAGTTTIADAVRRSGIGHARS